MSWNCVWAVVSFCLHGSWWYFKQKPCFNLKAHRYTLLQINMIPDPPRIEWVIGFNIVYQQFRAMYDTGFQICCNWHRLNPGFNVPVHQNTMPQINMIPHPVTLNWHWANQPCSRPLMVNANQGSSRCQFLSLWLDLTRDSNPDLPHSERTLYPLSHRGGNPKDWMNLNFGV